MLSWHGVRKLLDECCLYLIEKGLMMTDVLPTGKATDIAAASTAGAVS